MVISFLDRSILEEGQGGDLITSSRTTILPFTSHETNIYVALPIYVNIIKCSHRSAMHSEINIRRFQLCLLKSK